MGRKPITCWSWTKKVDAKQSVAHSIVPSVSGLKCVISCVVENRTRGLTSHACLQELAGSLKVYTNLWLHLRPRVGQVSGQARVPTTHWLFLIKPKCLQSLHATIHLCKSKHCFCWLRNIWEAHHFIETFRLRCAALWQHCLWQLIVSKASAAFVITGHFLFKKHSLFAVNAAIAKTALCQMQGLTKSKTQRHFFGATTRSQHRYFASRNKRL